MAERRGHRAAAHRVEVAAAGAVLEPHPLAAHDHGIAAVELRQEHRGRGAVDEQRAHRTVNGSYNRIAPANRAPKALDTPGTTCDKDSVRRVWLRHRDDEHPKPRESRGAGDRGRAGRVPRGRRRRGRRSGCSGEGGVPGLARGRPRLARRDPALDRRRDRGAAGGPRPARDAERRQADRRLARRGRDGRERLPLLRRRSRAPPRRHDPGRRRHRHDLPGADGRGRDDRALELPAADRVVEGRARARRREHDRAQAGGADAPDRARAREDRGRGGPAGGRAERRRRPGPDRRRAARRAP